LRNIEFLSKIVGEMKEGQNSPKDLISALVAAVVDLDLTVSMQSARIDALENGEEFDGVAWLAAQPDIPANFRSPQTDA
jgi:hypothetical protein